MGGSGYKVVSELGSNTLFGWARGMWLGMHCHGYGCCALGHYMQLVLSCMVSVY